MVRPGALLAPRSALWLAFALACASEEQGEDGELGSSEDEGAMACQAHEDCASGTCDLEMGTCVGSCDPATEQIGPEPRDQPGDACCTEKPGCSGYDRKGEPIIEGYVGDTLACIDGQWVLDPDYCEPTNPDGVPLLGCVWDSTQGSFVKPQCVYQG